MLPEVPSVARSLVSPPVLRGIMFRSGSAGMLPEGERIPVPGVEVSLGAAGLPSIALPEVPLLPPVIPPEVLVLPSPIVPPEVPLLPPFIPPEELLLPSPIVPPDVPPLPPIVPPDVPALPPILPLDVPLEPRPIVSLDVLPLPLMAPELVGEAVPELSGMPLVPLLVPDSGVRMVFLAVLCFICFFGCFSVFLLALVLRDPSVVDAVPLGPDCCCERIS